MRVALALVALGLIVLALPALARAESALQARRSGPFWTACAQGLLAVAAASALLVVAARTR